MTPNEGLCTPDTRKLISQRNEQLNTGGGALGLQKRQTPPTNLFLSVILWVIISLGFLYLVMINLSSYLRYFIVASCSKIVQRRGIYLVGTVGLVGLVTVLEITLTIFGGRTGHPIRQTIHRFPQAPEVS
jgi:hypothetical protein